MPLYIICLSIGAGLEAFLRLRRRKARRSAIEESIAITKPQPVVVRPDAPQPVVAIVPHEWHAHDDDSLSCIHCKADLSLAETSCPRSPNMSSLVDPSCDYRRMVLNEIEPADYAERLRWSHRKTPVRAKPDETWQDFAQSRTIH